MLVEAITRSGVGNFVSALFEVYILLIFLYILLNLLFSFGMKLPYARWSAAGTLSRRVTCCANRSRISSARRGSTPPTASRAVTANASPAGFAGTCDITAANAVTGSAAELNKTANLSANVNANVSAHKPAFNTSAKLAFCIAPI